MAHPDIAEITEIEERTPYKRRTKTGTVGPAKPLDSLGRLVGELAAGCPTLAGGRTKTGTAMKPPDDAASRYALLRRQLVDAFMDENVDAWLEAKERLTRLLREQGVPVPIRGRPRKNDPIR